MKAVSEIDIYRSANTRIEQYGEFGAELHAAQRADELLRGGDMDGRRTWLRVMKAVRDITRKELDEAVH